jgi:hypothetical protein
MLCKAQPQLAGKRLSAASAPRLPVRIAARRSVRVAANSAAGQEAQVGFGEGGGANPVRVPRGPLAAPLRRVSRAPRQAGHGPPHEGRRCIIGSGRSPGRAARAAPLAAGSCARATRRRA